MPGHNGARICLILLAILVFILSGVFNFLGSSGQAAVIFQNSTVGISDLYSTEITPADFTFSVIWIIIYIYQGLFLIYAFCTLLRVSGPGFLYTSPNYLPPAIYISFIVAHVCTIIWTFLWDNEQLEASLFFLLLAAIAAYVALSLASFGVFTNQKQLISYGHAMEYRYVYALVINPLGLYAMWLTIASLINLSVVLVFSVGVSQNAGGSISLAVLTGLVIGYSLVDLAFFERYFRYLYTPFMTLIWAFIGILIGSLDWDTSNSVFTFGLTIVVIVVFLLKLFLSVVRCMRKPLFPNTSAGGGYPNGTIPGAPYGGPPVVTVMAGPSSAPPPQHSLPSWPSLS